MNVLGRVRPGVTIEQAQAELSTIARRLDEQRAAAEQGRGISLVPLSLQLVGPQSRLALWMLTGAVFCVLLIGVTNITSLSLARSAGREREFALRSALGASHGRVLRQLFTESITLATLSGLAGLLVARAAIPIIMAFKPADLVSVGNVASMRRRSSGASVSRSWPEFWLASCRSSPRAGRICDRLCMKRERTRRLAHPRV